MFRYGNRLVTAGENVAALTEAGQPLSASLPLRIGVRTAARRLDFALGPFDVPVVTLEVASVLADAAGQDVQMFSARVDGYHGEYAVVNAVALVDAIDFKRSGGRVASGEGRPT